MATTLHEISEWYTSKKGLKLRLFPQTIEHQANLQILHSIDYYKHTYICQKQHWSFMMHLG